MPYFDSHDKTRLWYEIKGEGVPLVCLAGGPGMDVRSLGDLGGLAAHRRLVLLDARAAGRSGVPTDRTTCAFTAQADDVEQLRRRLGVERVDILAHSAAALTAQEYAARYGRVRRMVLVTPAGRLTREPDEAEAAAIRAAGALTAVPGDICAPPVWLREAFYAGSPAESGTAGRLARLAGVLAPVLAVAGAADGIAGTATSRLIAGCYPHGRAAVLAGCGHYPWLDDPDRFRTCVLGFLSG